MKVAKEIDNDDCRAALKLATTNPSLFRVPDPISMGALLWHDLIEIRGDAVHLTAKGQILLAEWHPGLAPTARQGA